MSDICLIHESLFVFFRVFLFVLYIYLSQMGSQQLWCGGEGELNVRYLSYMPIYVFAFCIVFVSYFYLSQRGNRQAGNRYGEGETECQIFVLYAYISICIFVLYLYVYCICICLKGATV